AFDGTAFDLAIYAERLTVLLERAKDAFTDAPSPSSDSELFRVKAALIDGLVLMYQLRAEICGSNFSSAPCEALKPPVWLEEAPSAQVSLSELNQRVLWLQNAAGPFIDIGCERAKLRSKNPMICSVE
ncbi:MAG: hypothetical protein AAF449_04465, partial [Myxococcota bacterium]